MRFPHISVVINNGTNSYDFNTDGSVMMITGCDAEFRHETLPSTISIRYLHNRLTVSIDLDQSENWIECFSINDVFLPTMFYFGFTAGTGDLSDNHDIISIRTNKLFVDEPRSMGDRRTISPSGPTKDKFYRSQVFPESQVMKIIRTVFISIFFVCFIVGLVLLYFRVLRRRPTFY